MALDVKIERCPTCQRFLPIEPDDMAKIREQIGRNLRHARVEAGMTQDEVARNFDPPIARAVITRIENGQQSLEVERLVMMASILGVDWKKIVEL